MVIDPDPGIEPVSPGDVPDPGIETVSPASPALAGGFFTTEPPGMPSISLCDQKKFKTYI